MSLLKPHLGELLDRYAILDMRDTAAADEEAQELEKVIAEEILPATVGPAPSDLTRTVVLAVVLGAVNGRLWELTERLHAGEEVSARAMHRLNEYRASLVCQLGSLRREEPLPTEKVYRGGGGA